MNSLVLLYYDWCFYALVLKRRLLRIMSVIQVVMRVGCGEFTHLQHHLVHAVQLGQVFLRVRVAVVHVNGCGGGVTSLRYNGS